MTDHRRKHAIHRIRARRYFAIYVVFYVALAIYFVAEWARSDSPVFWPIWPLLGGAIGLAAHGSNCSAGNCRSPKRGFSVRSTATVEHLAAQVARPSPTYALRSLLPTAVFLLFDRWLGLAAGMIAASAPVALAAGRRSVGGRRAIL